MSAPMLPGLSEIRSADWGYLRDAGAAWCAAAKSWERAFADLGEAVQNPCGTPWEGDAANAMRGRVFGDRSKVNGVAYLMRERKGPAAKAGDGADAQEARRNDILNVVTNIGDEGFDVAEDYSVTDRQAGYASEADRNARQDRATALHGYLVGKVVDLVAAETKLQADLVTASEEMQGYRFPDETGTDGGAGAGSGESAAEDHLQEIIDKWAQLDPVDPDEAARYYNDSGQRAHDEFLVNRAVAEGRNPALARVGERGYFTAEESAAAGRLRDYRAITSTPSADAAGDAAREAAGQRLDDHNLSRYVGPLPADPITGLTARDRALRRLKLQDDLERGNLSWHQQPMLPDDATQLVNRLEVQDRAAVLSNTVDALVDNGMSRLGAESVVDQLAGGTPLDRIIHDGEKAGAGLSVAGKGMDTYAGAVTDHGRHWTPEAKAVNAADVAALQRIADRIGKVGNAAMGATAAYELLVEHQSPVKVGMETLGGWAGMEAFAPIGGTLGSPGGPIGIFVGATVFGAIGAVGGQAAAHSTYQWLTK